MPRTRCRLALTGEGLVEVKLLFQALTGGRSSETGLETTRSNAQ